MQQIKFQYIYRLIYGIFLTSYHLISHCICKAAPGISQGL